MIRAMQIHELGDVRDLALGECPSLPCGPNEVRIRVAATGVNFPDILMCEGRYQVKPSLPLTPGLEVAGEVIEVGAGAERLQPGDRVMAFARHGGGYVVRQLVETRELDVVDSTLTIHLSDSSVREVQFHPPG